MEDNTEFIINTLVSKIEPINAIKLSSRMHAGRNMQIDDNEYFEEHEEEIKKFNENMLMDSIRKSCNEKLIEKYSSRFAEIIYGSNLTINDTPVSIHVRNDIDSLFLDLLFDLGFHPEIINDIMYRMKR